MSRISAAFKLVRFNNGLAYMKEWRVKGEGWSVKSEVWSVKSEEWRVKCKEWSVKGEGWREWNVRRERWEVKCEYHRIPKESSKTIYSVVAYVWKRSGGFSLRILRNLKVAATDQQIVAVKIAWLIGVL